MQRWFYANEQVICKSTTPSLTPRTPSATPPRAPSPIRLPDRNWKFSVKFNGKLCCNETLAVSGSAKVLGEWDLQKSLALTKDEFSSLWTVKVTLPAMSKVQYRYLICATNTDGYRIVRFWETHKGARRIECRDEHDLESESFDMFGFVDGVCQIERGWISNDAVVVQLKLVKAPYLCRKKKLNSTLPYVKITPLKMKRPETLEMVYCPKLLESNLETNSNEFAFCEVASLNQDNFELNEFHYQPKYGSFCGPDDVLIFLLTLCDMINTVYRIDLYEYPPKAAFDVPPYHIGYQFVLPHEISGSQGILKLNILCATKHRLIGCMNCDYLVVKPLSSHNFSLKETVQSYCEIQNQPLEIARSGCGSMQDSILKINETNFHNKISNHGANVIQFEIQLNHDSVPVVCNDLLLYTSQGEDSEKDVYDIWKFTLNENDINDLKLYGRVLKSNFISMSSKNCKAHEILELKTTLNPRHPKLEQILQEFPPNVRLNIELQCQYFKPDIDKNVYVDKILEIVLKLADSRLIVMSSPDADICTLIRLKQNRFPVVFIFQESMFSNAVQNSSVIDSNYVKAMGLSGVMFSVNTLMPPSPISNIYERNIQQFARNLMQALRNAKIG